MYIKVEGKLLETKPQFLAKPPRNYFNGGCSSAAFVREAVAMLRTKQELMFIVCVPGSPFIISHKTRAMRL